MWVRSDRCPQVRAIVVELLSGTRTGRGKLKGMRAVAIARLRPTVAPAVPPVAIVYAIGIYWIVWSLAIGLVVSASLFVRLPVSALYLPATALISSAAATAVALRSGGWRSVLGLTVLGLAYAFFLVCRSGAAGVGTSSCDPARVFSAHIAEVVGSVVGLPLALALRSRDGTSATLLAAAIIAIAIPLLRLAFAPLGPLTGSAAYDEYLWAIRLQVGAAIAAGAIIAWRATRALAALLILAAGLLLPWAGSLRSWWEDTLFLRTNGIVMNLPAIIQTQWQLFLPPIFVGCVLLGFIAERIGNELRRRATHRATAAGPSPTVD
jgi:hypothetical protein